MEIGLKVVCIKTESNYPKLIVGKKFTITDKCRGASGNARFPDFYKLISDDGEKVNWIEINYFNPLSEYRNEKLKNLLYDI